MEKLSIENLNEIIEAAGLPTHEALKTLWEKEKNKLLNSHNVLYHYTDTNALLNGIITDKQNDDERICLWATDWSCLNDKAERETGLEYFRMILNGNEPVIKLHEDNTKNNKIICFSTRKDYLPMWSMYGKNGSGVMLEFDLKKLENNYGYRLLPCAYVDTNFDKKLREKIRNCELGASIENLNINIRQLVLLRIAVCYVCVRKNCNFNYENEVRLYGFGNKIFGDNEREEFHRTNNGFKIPYSKIYFSKDILKKVWLGPNQDMDLSMESLRRFLDSKGLENVEVKTSNIPYRG